MQKNIFSQIEKAQHYDYINLLPQSKTHLQQISKLTEQIFLQSFKHQLSFYKKEDEKQSTEQQFMRFKQEAHKLKVQFMKQREELKSDEQIGQLQSKLHKQCSQWQERFDRIAAISKSAFSHTESILSNLISQKKVIQLDQEKRNIFKKLDQCQGIIKGISKKVYQHLLNCQKIKQAVSPNFYSIKYSVSKQIILNLNEYFNEELALRLLVNDEVEKNIQQIEEIERNIIKFLNTAMEKFIDDPQDQTLYQYIQQELLFKIDIQNVEKGLDKFKVKGDNIKLNEHKKAIFHDLISNMIDVKQEKVERRSHENSKYLIQPINQSKKYIIADVTNPTFGKKKWEFQAKIIQFYGNMGFVHLSRSLVVAGGYKSPNIQNAVFQLFQDQKQRIHPPMSVSRSAFPMVEFNDGNVIVAICGQNLQKTMDQCEKLDEFKYWRDLPSTNDKFSSASACSIEPSTIFVFGGVPCEGRGRLIKLDLSGLASKWQNISTHSSIFLKRNQDSACFIKEKKKIVIFGNFDERGWTSQFNVKDDMELERGNQLKPLPFNYYHSWLITYKTYKGAIYSFNNELDKLWKYQDAVWK